MRQQGLLLGAGMMLLSALSVAAQFSNWDAIAMYAADASAALALPATVHRLTDADDQLARQVTDEISGIVASGAAQVDVMADAGHVVLKGRVSSESVISQLLETAAAVDGVKEVKSELKIIAS